MCTTSARPSTRRYTAHAAPADPTRRVGDPERESTAARLGLAFTQGYLSMDEYEARLGHAFTAQSAGDLGGLTSDLPLDQISRRDPLRQAARRRAAKRGLQVHLIGYVAMSLLLIGIWLAVAVAGGSWYFWPIWPILGVGVGVIGHMLEVARARPGAQSNVAIHQSHCRQAQLHRTSAH